MPLGAYQRVGANLTAVSPTPPSYSYRLRTAVGSRNTSSNRRLAARPRPSACSRALPPHIYFHRPILRSLARSAQAPGINGRPPAHSLPPSFLNLSFPRCPPPRSFAIRSARCVFVSTRFSFLFQRSCPRSPNQNPFQPSALGQLVLQATARRSSPHDY